MTLKSKNSCIQFHQKQFCQHFNLDQSRVYITPLGYEKITQITYQEDKSKLQHVTDQRLSVYQPLERKNQLTLVYEFNLSKIKFHTTCLVGGGNIRYVNKVKDLL